MRKTRARIGSILLTCALVLSMLPVTALAEGAADCDGESCTHEAAIGSTHYATLKDAADEAQSHSVITLLKDVELEAQVTIPADVTLDGWGNTISVGAASWSSTNPGKYMLVCGANATVKDVTIDAENNASGCLQFYKADGGKIEGSVTLENARQLGLNINAAQVTAAGTLTLSGNGWGNIINVGWGSGISGYAGICSFDAREAKLVGVTGVYADKSDISRAGGISKFLIQLSDDFVLLNQTEAGYVYTLAVAETGGTKYPTLAAAVAAVESEGTVRLLATSEGTGIKVEGTGKKITIDLGGYGYTVTSPLVGSAGTQTNGLQLLKGNEVTIQNGALYFPKEAKMGIKNYCDLTIENVEIHAEGGLVAVANCGQLTISGSKTKITTDGKWAVTTGNYTKGDQITTNIQGGEIDSVACETPLWSIGDATVDESVTTTIYGGTIGTLGVYDWRPDYGDEYKDEPLLVNWKMYVKGGVIGDLAFDESAAGKIFISGGTFSADPSDYVTDGCQIFQKDDRYVVGEPATSVTIAPTLDLDVGQTETLTAEVDPSSYTDLVVWSSDDEDVAVVENGVVTAVAPGTAVITAAVGSVSDTCTVTVNNARVISVTLDRTELTLLKDGSTTLTATVAPAGADQIIAWSSSDETVAAVENGVVTAVGAGETIITAEAGGVKATCVVTVPAESTEVLPSVGTPDVKVDPALDDLDEAAAEAVTGAASSVDAGDALSDAARQQVEELNRDSAEKNGLLEKGAEKLEPAQGETVTLYTQTYLEVTATAAETAQGSVTSVTLNITPMVQVVASTASTDFDVSEQNSVVVKEAEKLDISASTKVTVQLPTSFAEQLVYIKHEAFDLRKTYFYKAAAGADGTLTFTNPHGFSPFTFSLENGAVAEVNDVGYTTLEEAVEAVSNNGTVILVDDNDETIEIQKNITFTLDTNGYSFTGSISAGSRYDVTMSEKDGKITYTFAREDSSDSSSGGSAGDYIVSVASVSGGKVTVSPGRADQGDTVTVTVVPNDGYELDKLTVTGKSGDELKLTGKGNGRYAFTMPNGPVTVKAVFVQKSGAEPETPEASFADVPEGFWACNEINWAYENGYMKGISTTAFNPNGPVTRQQVWMTLARMAGANPADMTAAKAWAVNNGISDGTNPGGAVTRQQMVVLLYRFAQRNGYDVSARADLSSYPDRASVAAYAADAMAWSVAGGIVGGTAQGMLNPGGTATRAQFAVILWRFYQTCAK